MISIIYEQYINIPYNQEKLSDRLLQINGDIRIAPCNSEVYHIKYSSDDIRDIIIIINSLKGNKRKNRHLLKILVNNIDKTETCLNMTDLELISFITDYL